MMYMNGRGVLLRTAELNNRLFDTLPHAIGGWSLAILAPFTCWMFILHRHPWEPPLADYHWIAAGLISFPCMVFGIWLASFWHRALAAVKTHRKAMEAETALRGKGWAQS